jgi:hypothetical protein
MRRTKNQVARSFLGPSGIMNFAILIRNAALFDRTDMQDEWTPAVDAHYVDAYVEPVPR